MKLHVLEQMIRALVLEMRPQMEVTMGEEAFDAWLVEQTLDGLERIQRAGDRNPKEREAAEEVETEEVKKDVRGAIAALLPVAKS